MDSLLIKSCSENRSEPATKRQILFNSTAMRYLEHSNVQRQKAEGGGSLGLRGGGERRELLYNKPSFGWGR